MCEYCCLYMDADVDDIELQADLFNEPIGTILGSKIRLVGQILCSNTGAVLSTAMDVDSVPFEHYVNVDINFCPICGRDLRGRR